MGELFEITNNRGLPMAKRQGRESSRKDVWLSEEDMGRIRLLAEEMKRRGLDPQNQYGKLSISKVIQWVLEERSSIIEGKTT